MTDHWLKYPALVLAIGISLAAIIFAIGWAVAESERAYAASGRIGVKYSAEPVYREPTKRGEE